MPEGEGFAGQHGRQGYVLTLSVFLRLFLMLAGLVFAWAAMAPLAKIVSSVFEVAVSAADASNLTIIGLHDMIAYIVLLIGIMVVLCHKLFGLITHLPDYVMRWLGQGFAGSGPMGETHDEGKVSSHFGSYTGRLGTAVSAGVGGRVVSGAGGRKNRPGANEEQHAPGDKRGDD